MPNANQSDARKNFVPRYLPWVLGAVMFIVFWATLNPWVTMLNLPQLAVVSGWVWQPRVFNPLIFLVTLPFRVLPAAHLPGVLNIFSGLCAAASLGILARCVAILPHDRTEMERVRERSDFGFLTGWVAWLPPIAAVVFAGLQLSFWENATSFTGESFQLLLFAVILWQLLEYRLDESEVRLGLATFLFGAAVTENWAMIGFVPVFLMMLIWLRKLDFFNVRFLLNTVMCGLAGLLFFFLLPVVAKASAHYPVTLWDLLKPNLRQDWLVMRCIEQAPVRHSLALMSLTTLLPAFVMSIRWSSSFGDSSRMGTMLVNYVMHAVNAILFGVLLWSAFDPPFSARALLQSIIPGVPALTLYYIGALCIGYYCGYALLIFGRKAIGTRRNPRPDPALPESLLWLCPLIVFLTLAVTVVAAGVLIYKNAPIIHAVNGDALAKCARYSVQNLPRGGAILLCDSDDPTQDQPMRGFLIQAELAREGRSENFPVVDTQSLNWAPYHAFLHREYPKVWPRTVTTNEVAAMSPLRIFLLLGQLARSNNLCYLNPSFGYYFEQFYLEPHGLSYWMKPLPEKTFLPPAPDANLLAENEAFFTDVLGSVRPAIEHALNPPDYKRMTGPLGWIMKHLHATAEPDANALTAAATYSRSLNYLGVDVQRAGDLQKAESMFSDAQEFNSNNIVASVNLAFNKKLREHAPTPVNPGSVTADRFGKYHDWVEVVGANGPYDDTTYCFDYGVFLMQSTPPLWRQAAANFNRVYQLAPENLATRFFLAQIAIFSRLPDKALEVLDEPLAHPAKFALTGYDENSTELNVLAAGAHFQRNENAAGAALLEKEVSRHPDNETLLLSAAQSFNMRGMYTNSLDIINLKLARSPDDPQWLYGKGIVSIQIKDYPDGIKALTRFLQIMTNSADALYNRGFAYFQSDQLDLAKADFQKLQSVYTNSFPLAYGLGEIAWREHNTNEAIRNYQIFVNYAPTNAAELKSVRERLDSIKR